MTEWYRNTEWNDEIEDLFFAKLAKARSQRDQYLVLQAHHLAFSHPEVSLRLIDIYFETRTDDFDDGRALKVTADAKFASGGYREALDDYLRVLEDNGSDQGVYVGSPLDFVFLTARFRSETHYDAAQDQLARIEMPVEGQLDPRFRYLASSALLQRESGQGPANALSMVRMALAMPPDILEPYPEIVWRLRGITRN